MNTVRSKLTRLGVAPEVVETLVEAGLDTPRKIKAAEDEDLRKAKANKDDKVKAWRKKK